MKNLLPLMLREWLQHRFAWALIVLGPLVVSLLLLSVGTIELDAEMTDMAPTQLSLMVAVMSMVGTATIVLLLLGVTSLFIALGSPRRDDADRSIEFWLSLPSGHAESLLAPVLVHLLLVPAAALVVGAAVALPVSMMTVGRVTSLGEWIALPWGQILPALGALLLRTLAGLPMALLWLLPLVLAAMMANALFRRWGLPLLAVVLILLAQGLERVFGQPVLTETLSALLAHAATSLAGAGDAAILGGQGSVPLETLAFIPGWALRDFGAAVKDLFQPLLAGALLVSAGLFAALVSWRRRGASLG
jgi:ABC-2 type transport system permease protein